MASEENIQAADALEILDPKLYQMLVKRAAHNRQWAEYFLLVNTCYEIIKRVPTIPEACNEADIEDLLTDTIERFGKVIYEVLPGGTNEFSQYMPDTKRKRLNQDRQQQQQPLIKRLS